MQSKEIKNMFDNWMPMVVFACGQIIALIWIVSAVRRDTSSLATEVAGVKTEMKKLVEILVEQGRQEERQNGMDGRLTAQGLRLDDLTRKLDRFFEPKPIQ